MLDGLHAKRGGDVRLAGTGPTDQHDVVDGLDKVTPVKALDQGFVDLAGRKVEAGQVAIGPAAGGLELICHGADLSLGGLRLEQLGDTGMAASKAGAPCCASSSTACAMPYIFKLRSRMTRAPLAGS